MNIGIDARPLVEKKVGFGYFLMNMIEEIFKIDKKNYYFLISDREIFFDISQYNNVKKIYYKDTFYCPKSFYYFFYLAKHLKKTNIDLDVFWGTEHLMPRGFSEKTKKIVTIHDFTHLKFPQSTTKYNLLISKLFFGRSIKNSDEVICISKNTEKELREYFAKECLNKKITTIYEGGYRDEECGSLNIELNNVREGIREYNHKDYILFVGTIEPRKNIKLLIDAAPRLEDIFEIVVCGKIGWESKNIVEKIDKTSNLKYFNYVSQDEKAYLMKNAFCQVQPSLYEGFGLPVVESMQSGTVVVVAKNSSLNELIEMEELKFETLDVTDFCEKIRTLKTDEYLYREMKEYCKNRGKYFSWGKAAKAYLSIIEGT